MRKARNSKFGYVLAFTVGLLFIVSGCSSSSDSAAVPSTVTVSGTISSSENPPPNGEPGVQVKGFYSDADPANPSTTTAADGTYSLTVDTSKAVSLQISKDGFVPFNFEKVRLTANVTDADEDIVTEQDVQAVIDSALGASTTSYLNKAWVVVDITDSLGQEVNGESISLTPAPDVEVYTLCDGTDSGGNETTGAPCPDDRPVMYLAYYDAAPGDVTATVGGETKTGPVRMGEITILDFEDFGAAQTVALSGKVTSSVFPAGEPGVTVTGFYTNPGLGTPTTTTAADGTFTLEVLANTPVSLQLSKGGLTTLNFARQAFGASFSGFDIEVPTVDEANTVIGLAFAGQTLASGAWLAVNVVDATGTEVEGVTITATQTNILGEAATDCDGSDSGDIVTVYPPCVPERDGPMYFAYYSTDQDITVSVTGVAAPQTGPVRNGEVTFLEFVR